MHVHTYFNDLLRLFLPLLTRSQAIHTHFLTPSSTRILCSPLTYRASRQYPSCAWTHLGAAAVVFARYISSRVHTWAKLWSSQTWKKTPFTNHHVLGLSWISWVQLVFQLLYFFFLGGGLCSCLLWFEICKWGTMLLSWWDLVDVIYKWATTKTLVPCHYTGCLIGILLMVYYNIL